MRTRILKSKAPDCSGAFALEGTIRPSKKCQYLPPLFGPTPLSVSGSTLPSGFTASPLLAPLRLLDPVVMPFSCFVFLPELAPGTDVSFIGRAGRGLALSRRHKRRAEER